MFEINYFNLDPNVFLFGETWGRDFGPKNDVFFMRQSDEDGPWHALVLHEWVTFFSSPPLNGPKNWAHNCSELPVLHSQKT